MLTKHKQAQQLRQQGLSYAKIAQCLEYRSEQGARTACNRRKFRAWCPECGDWTIPRGQKDCLVCGTPRRFEFVEVEADG